MLREATNTTRPIIPNQLHYKKYFKNLVGELGLGRRFDKVDASTAGDHWVLDSKGHLQLRNNKGLIATEKKFK